MADDDKSALQVFREQVEALLKLIGVDACIPEGLWDLILAELVALTMDYQICDAVMEEDAVALICRVKETCAYADACGVGVTGKIIAGVYDEMDEAVMHQVMQLLKVMCDITEPLRC
jgi:hypothetical protein